MIYPSDFSFYSKKLPKNKIFHQKFQNKKIIQKSLTFDSNSGNGNKNEQESLWKEYCLTSTVHGLKYIVDRQFNFFERYLN